MTATGLRSICHEQQVDRRLPRPRHHIAAGDGLMPAREIETEPGGACSDREAGVIDALDLGPVVTARKALVWRLAKAPHVERHRALPDTKLRCYLPLREPLLV